MEELSLHSKSQLPEKPSSSNNTAMIEEYLNKRYDFRHNVVTGQLEFKGKKDNKFISLQDRDENSLWREIQKNSDLEYAKATCSLSSLRAILHSNFSKEFDPLKDYFTTLPKWDQKTDHIADLANTVKTDNDALFQRLLKKWLVGIVGSAIPPHAVNQTALIFSGKQGVGKTTWILNLMPKQLRTYTYTGTINPTNKDTFIYLSNCMIINLDELENLNSSEVGALKELITKPQIKLRRPYGRNSEDLPRRASFAGSVNSSQFLNDSTGSRRFLCFEALEFDYQHKVDMDKVYAQAYSLFNQGFKHWLDKEEIKELEKNNSKFQRSTVEEDLVLEELLPAKEGDSGCLFYTTTQIASLLATKVSSLAVNSATIQRLGRALKKHGYKAYKKGGLQKYAVSLKQPDRDSNSGSIPG